jgi:hypothetical protein
VGDRRGTPHDSGSSLKHFGSRHSMHNQAPNGNDRLAQYGKATRSAGRVPSALQRRDRVGLPAEAFWTHGGFEADATHEADAYYQRIAGISEQDDGPNPLV